MKIIANLNQSPVDDKYLQPMLSIRDLSWQVKDLSILKDINIDIHRDGFVGLIGPNGSGKTSLLRVLYRFLNPTKGQVSLNGKSIWQYSQREYSQFLGVVLQEPPRKIGLSVEQVVALGMIPKSGLFNWAAPTDKQIHLVLEQVGLTNFSKANFDDLSGGEKQRCMIARALIQEPELLIFDEPTNHLDIHYQFDILNLVRKIGKTAIASIHDLNLAMTYCDSVIVLDKGCVAAQGKPEDIITSQLLNDVFQVKGIVDVHPVSKLPHIFVNYGVKK
jgi:iron complex transport system ATP-binding protein